ncbi:hypothetical protein GOP47_0008804 [Adiantum capillus-veneris]|uniref:Uncharacterized protein n=1 Tax=Adiantum capillus-veneris TaxID=13818 RepID=A0A9D4UZC0_ADICA|nr:hypothetical protein GOP47_0008804 [Adiantum capillus-veneris]
MLRIINVDLLAAETNSGASAFKHLWAEFDPHVTSLAAAEPGALISAAGINSAASGFKEIMAAPGTNSSASARSCCLQLLDDSCAWNIHIIR